jgi:hypothetical protein
MAGLLEMAKHLETTLNWRSRFSLGLYAEMPGSATDDATVRIAKQAVGLQ